MLQQVMKSLLTCVSGLHSTPSNIHTAPRTPASCLHFIAIRDVVVFFQTHFLFLFLVLINSSVEVDLWIHMGLTLKKVSSTQEVSLSCQIFAEA